MIGSNNDELQTFLKAYKCSSEDQSERPPIMYSFGILPNYSEEIIGKLGHSASKISSISLNTDISAASKQNFNLLLKLSEIELTPFSILNLAKTIEFDLQSLLTFTENTKQFPAITRWILSLKVEYSKNCEQNDVRKINEHQDFLHFAEAVHVNWNPYKELLIALKTFKYVYLCSETGLGYFGSIIERFDQKLLNDLVKEARECLGEVKSTTTATTTTDNLEKAQDEASSRAKRTPHTPDRT
uniref:Uncharacterized protein n=1 Tax=Globodera rostochiensis TaxID=31243 RepID=A0A914IBZ5_GLORO